MGGDARWRRIRNLVKMFRIRHKDVRIRNLAKMFRIRHIDADPIGFGSAALGPIFHVFFFFKETLYCTVQVPGQLDLRIVTSAGTARSKDSHKCQDS